MLNLGELISRRTLLKTSLLTAPVCARSFANERNEPPLHFVAKTLEGARFTSDELKGKVVLIDFWASWCPYCAREVRAVDNLIHDFESKGLVVLSVNMGEPRRKVKKYLEENPRSSKVVLAEDTTLAAICQAKTYPDYVLLNREGEIAGRQHGAAGEGALRRLLTRVGLEDS